jgi:hypothetical protein
MTTATTESTRCCSHRFVKWCAWKNGVYRLICAACGVYVGSESYVAPVDDRLIDLMEVINDHYH